MKSSIKIPLLFIIYLGITLPLTAQQGKNAVVKGIITDEKTIPARGVTVSLVRSTDSIPVVKLLTNDKGEFEISAQSDLAYFLQVSATGYETWTGGIFMIKSGAVNTHDTIRLKPVVKQLGNVVITATKPLIEVKPGKLVMNVENSIVAAGTSVFEMLEKVPGVTIDKNGTISVQGKAGILLLIDGRPTYLSNADLANMLQSMQSDQVAAIELMTATSAKYDANGNAGIINIKTKSSKNLGTNGSVLAGAGFGKFEKTNTGFTINYRSKKINLFSNYGYNYNKRFKKLDIDRLAVSNNEMTAFEQNSVEISKQTSHNIKAGLDYSITKKMTAGLLFTALTSTDKRVFEGNTFMSKPQQSWDSTLVFENKIDKETTNFSYNFNFRNEFGKNNQTFNFDADYATFTAREHTDYINRFYRPGNIEYRPQLLYRSQTPAGITIKSIKADYVYPVKKGMQIEAGFKIANVKTNNRMLFEEQRSTGEWSNDPRRTNQFRYDETVYALYMGGGFSFKKMTTQWGMRIEQSHTRGNSETTGSVITRKYTDYFPSVEISRIFSPKHMLKLNYSKRLQRPNYQTLNPFVYYLDQYGYNTGNPYLNPQYAHNMEVTYVFRSKYIAQAGISYIKDIIAEVLLPDTINKALYATYENLDRQLMYRLSVSSPFTITKWWKNNTSISAMHMGFKTSDLNGKRLDAGQFFTLVNTNNTFTFGKGFSAELSGKYTSGLIYSTIKVNAMLFADIGFAKSFLHQKASLKLSVNDIFNSMRQQVSSVYPGLSYQLNQKLETRILRLSFTYRFGNSSVNAHRNRATGLESEKERLHKTEQ